MTEVFKTKNGTPYLKEPGVVILSRPQFDYQNLVEFTGGFDPSLEFENYSQDFADVPLGPEGLIKFAGQLCYLSLGPQRTYNKDASAYFKNIISSKHGSVLEHAQYSFLFWGISRSLTHELVRHRAGCAYSQVSQRYVDGSKLRFVERPEYQDVPELHTQFEDRIDGYAKEYNALTESLLSLQNEGHEILSGDSKRELRKRVQSASRSCLPNETEAPIVFSANLRALRHIIEMRCSKHAEIEIRRLFNKVFQLVSAECPNVFADFTMYALRDKTLEIQPN